MSGKPSDPGPTADGLWVVKLGGSLFAHDLVPPWLAALGDAGPGRVVIVTGGGPFADTVRVMQRRLGFSDDAAHDMALDAMVQGGRALADLHGAIETASDEAAIRAVLAGGRVAMWLPSAARLAREADIVRGWSTTSDSLAAWLAGRLDAAVLALVKSAPLPASETSISAILAAGLVDADFGRSAGRLRARVALYGRDDSARLGADLGRDRVGGVRVAW